MVIEDYVSFEVAKLLKEKGFNIQCRAAYTNYGQLFTTQIQQYVTNVLCSKGILWDCTAPTLQTACKWLREEHNLFIEIIVGETEGKTWYDYDIIPINGKVIYWKELDVSPPVIECNTPEEAIEIGLKYCLENLI